MGWERVPTNWTPNKYRLTGTYHDEYRRGKPNHLQISPERQMRSPILCPDGQVTKCSR
jgi:hypothetical protein